MNETDALDPCKERAHYLLSVIQTNSMFSRLMANELGISDERVAELYEEAESFQTRWHLQNRSKRGAL